MSISKIYTPFITVVAVFSLFLSFKNISEIKQLKSQLKEKDEKIAQLKKEKITLALKVKAIEEKIKKANKTLRRKGIKIKIPEPEGGIFIPAENIKPSDIYLKSLEKSISKFVSVISDIPVGVPLYGRLTSRFGYRRDPFNGRLAFHTGIDLKATYKQPVRATANGVVIFSGWKRGYGKVVIIRHKYGFETIYAHLAWKRVGINQPVKAGDIIGYAGSTGRSTGVHLHYEIRRYGKLVNPLKLLYLNNTNTL